MSQSTSTTGTAAARTQEGNGLSIAGLASSLVGLLFFPIILRPLAVIFGGIGWSKANRGARHKGMAIAAVVLGVVHLILMAVLAGPVGRRPRSGRLLRRPGSQVG